MVRYLLIFVCISLLTSGCSSSADGSVQTDISQRAKQTAVNLLINVEGTFKDINQRKPPYIRESNPHAYVYVYDLNLNVVAHPERGNIGTNHTQRVDDNRNAYAQEILKRALARKLGTEGWIEYTEQGLMRLAFFERAQGRDGAYYIVVSTAPVGGTLQTTQKPKK